MECLNSTITCYHGNKYGIIFTIKSTRKETVAKTQQTAHAKKLLQDLDQHNYSSIEQLISPRRNFHRVNDCPAFKKYAKIIEVKSPCRVIELNKQP